MKAIMEKLQDEPTFEIKKILTFFLNLKTLLPHLNSQKIFNLQEYW
jgi:hypothetical protein